LSRFISFEMRILIQVYLSILPLNYFHRVDDQNRTDIVKNHRKYDYDRFSSLSGVHSVFYPLGSFSTFKLHQPFKYFIKERKTKNPNTFVSGFL